MSRVLIIAEVRFYREGLAELLPKYGELEVCGTGAMNADMEALIKESAVDVVLIDGETANGLRVVRHLKEHLPDIHVIALSVAETPETVLKWAEAGASGFVAREASLEDLCAVIERTERGEMCCSPAVAAGMMARIYSLSRDLHAPSPLGCLTPREREVLGLLSDGLSNKHIARTLGIALATAKNHVHNVLAKLNATRRGEAAAIARRWDREN